MPQASNGAFVIVVGGRDSFVIFVMKTSVNNAASDPHTLSLQKRAAFRSMVNGRVTWPTASRPTAMTARAT
jgi:hypothetical protein